MSDPERLYPRHPLRALRSRLHQITDVAVDTRRQAFETSRHVLETRVALLGRVDALAAQLAEARREDQEWLRETLRVMHDREPERRQRLADLRASDSYDALYESEEPLVSVVIPTYRNHELLASRAIPSVLAQTYQRFEVIVVGDAAPEAAKDAVESFGDPRLSFHNLELRGPYPADPERRWLIAGGPPFNEAVRRARGEWIAPLDDDDAFRPDHIEALLEAARQRRLEFVYGRIAQHEPGGNLTELGLFPPELGQINLQAALYRADLRDIFGLELADALFGEPNDWAVCQRMMRSGVRLGMIDHLVVDYYPSSAWGRSANENERDAPLVTGAAEVSDEPSAAEWTYAPQGWAHELENGGGPGWDGSSVARMYAERWPAFLQNLKGNGPLGALHVVPLGQPMPREDLTSHNMAMVFAYALGLSAHMTDTLSILDWGGGLGHFHELARALVPDLKLDYHCKELPEVCEQGRRVSPEVTFHESSACLEHSYDLVLASGAIQYAEHWEELLGQLSSATRRYLLLTKVPITGAQSFVVLQRAHAYGYDTEYLGWALNSGEVRAAAQNAGLDLVREFFLSATVEVPNAPGSFQHAGFLFTPQQNARP